MTPEFSRPERLDTIGGQDRHVAIEANEAERQALATRFGLLAIGRLAAGFAVRREGAAVLATGRVEASVTQACSATGDPIEAAVDETVSLRFVDDDAAASDEIELAPDALDTLPIEGGAIDLGEAAAETMALALDPFPRSPAAADALRDAGVLEEGEAGPFGALAGLKAKLAGK
jgi:uncharacterized metal-binding protein YceD (DUF177 family)